MITLQEIVEQADEIAARLERSETVGERIPLAVAESRVRGV